MSKVVALNCPSCRAALPAVEEGESVTCAYCGREVRVDCSRGHSHGQGAGEVGDPRVDEAQAASARQASLLALGGFLLLIGAGAVFSLLAAGGSGGVMGRAATGPGAGGHVPPGEHMQWSGRAGAPIPVELAGDAIEDFIGRYQVLDGETLRPFVGAFDGQTFERRWGVSMGEALNQQVVPAVGAGRLVVGHGTEVQVIEIETGRIEHRLSLSDLVDFICVPDDAPARAWVRARDGSGQRMDLSTGKASAGERPEGCATPSRFGSIMNRGCPGWRADGAGSAGCVGSDRAELPPLPGLGPAYLLSEGSLRVVIGSKSPGTAVPMAAALGADDEVIWSSALAPGGPAEVQPSSSVLADLSQGRLFAIYQPRRGGSRLLALDAHTGKRLWDVLVPRSEDGDDPGSLRATPTRVYVPHWTWLEVFDAKDGRHLATVGMW